MRIVPIEYAENLSLAEDVFDLHGRIVIRKGATVTNKIISQLSKTGVFSVYVNDFYSQNQLIPPISSDLKLDITRELFKIYEIIRHRIENRKEVTESLLPSFDHIIKLSDHVIYEITRTPMQYVTFTDIKLRDLYTVSHSVNVATLSLLLAMDSGIEKARYRDVFIGALFHDIGMNSINENVFMKDGKLNVQEFIKIKEHPQKGYELFKDFAFANSYMKIIVLEHHEKLDGTGYPKQIAEKDIHVLAQLVSIVDVYDAMTSDRPYSRAVSPVEALQYITQASGKHFNPTLAELFIKKINPYPEGSLVQLNTGLTALVIKTNDSEPLKPFVLEIDPSTKKLNKIPMDLSKETDLTIETLTYRMP